MVAEKSEVSLLYKAASAGLAFIIWGSWGYFINSQASDPQAAAPLISGLIQGTGSSLVTLVMLKSVTWLYHWLAPHPLRLVLPAVITTTVTVSGMTVAHLIVGTSNLLATMAPGMVVAFCFNLATAFGLSRSEQQTGCISQHEN